MDVVMRGSENKVIRCVCVTGNCAVVGKHYTFRVPPVRTADPWKSFGQRCKQVKQRPRYHRDVVDITHDTVGKHTPS